MAKRKRKLPKLTNRGNQIVTLIVNAVAFQTHGDDAELDMLAKALGTTGPRLRPMLRKLEAQGWLTVEEKSLTFVYPTVAALRRVDPKLSEAQARAIVRRLKGRTGR
jgi:DNA-binding FadR family transcriptional regulator